MNQQNLANLTTQYQSAYLVYCYKMMRYLQVLAWLTGQQSTKVKPKSALRVKKLAQTPNQEKPVLKSLKHQGKLVVSTIVALGFPNGALSGALRYAFNKALHGTLEDSQEKSETEKLESAHEAVRKYVVSAAEDPDALIWLSTSDQETILAFELMQIRTKKSYGYTTDHVSTDTFIREAGLSDRTFLLEGYGRAIGGEFNYVSVGITSAHHGGSFVSTHFKVLAWNAYQMIRYGGYSYNYSQMFGGNYWAAYGFQYYQEHKND